MLTQTDSFFQRVIAIINASSVIDIIDILLVAFLLYQLLRLVRETRAAQLLKGILLLILLYAGASVLRLEAVPVLMENLFTIGAWALLVVFQPELRRALEHMGRTRLSKWFSIGFSNEIEEQNTLWSNAIDALGQACSFLSKRRIGALIVLERQSKLGEIINSGTVIDAVPSAELLGNIFFPNSPLHDGALIVREARLCAAGCFLPLSENYSISKEMGTRHRAALGMSEQSDAIVIVVSEETGVITVARDGKLHRGYTQEQLLRELRKLYLIEGEKGDIKIPFFKTEINLKSSLNKNRSEK